MKTVKEAEQEYTDYINEHIKNVAKAWEEVKEKCKDVISEYTCGYPDVTMAMIDSNIQTHDLSKFSKEEFDAYRKNFYPINEDEKKENENDFNAAWKHHYMNNPHHWDYWYHQGREGEMMLIYIIEMLCDWRAMSYKFNSSTLDYWEENKKNIHLGKEQTIIFEKLLNALGD